MAVAEAGPSTFLLTIGISVCRTSSGTAGTAVGQRAASTRGEIHSVTQIGDVCGEKEASVQLLETMLFRVSGGMTAQYDGWAWLRDTAQPAGDPSPSSIFVQPLGHLGRVGTVRRRTGSQNCRTESRTEDARLVRSGRARSADRGHQRPRSAHEFGAPR